MSTATKLARKKATDNFQDNILRQTTFKETPPKSVTCFQCGKILQRPRQFSCGHRFVAIFLLVLLICTVVCFNVMF